MTERHSIAEARRRLPTLVRDAENGRTVELTRRGEPVAVLIGRREYKRLTSGQRNAPARGTLAAPHARFTEAWRGFTASVDLKELALDPDQLFGDVRGHGSGRDVRL